MFLESLFEIVYLFVVFIFAVVVTLAIGFIGSFAIYSIFYFWKISLMVLTSGIYIIIMKSLEHKLYYFNSYEIY